MPPWPNRSLKHAYRELAHNVIWSLWRYELHLFQYILQLSKIGFNVVYGLSQIPNKAIVTEGTAADRSSPIVVEKNLYIFFGGKS